MKVEKYIKGHITGWKKDVLKFLQILNNTATSAKLSVTEHELRSLGRLAGHRQGKAWELAQNPDGTKPRSPERAGAASEVAVQLLAPGNLFCGLGPWGGNEIPIFPL